MAPPSDEAGDRGPTHRDAGDATPVVTCFLRNRDDVLLLRRSDAVGTYRGRWGAVSGHVRRRDGSDRPPEAAARAEIDEETGVLEHCDLVRTGTPFTIHDPAAGRTWRVHPFLYDCGTRDLALDAETAAVAWVPPPEILRRETVPALWTSYDRVRPTVETVSDDRTHGSAYLSLRALDVLRDRAGELAVADESEPPSWADFAALARELRAARPSMAAVANRINRAMATADTRDPEAVAASSQAVIGSALDADDVAAATAAATLAGRTVLTLSRSGTVLAALRDGDPARVYVAESRPGGEGVAVAESLAADGADVTLVPDAAVAQVLADGDVARVLVGADAVAPDGSVVNKVGTRAAAIAAAREDVPLHAVAARDKIVPPAPDDDVPTADATGAVDIATRERADPATVYDGDVDLAVYAPLFDVAPTDLVDGVVTEEGLLDIDEVAAIARAHRELADW